MWSDIKDSTAVVCPARNIAGALRLPGDKSISHRYAMLAAIAEGTSRLENFSTGADCASTLGCLAALGVDVQRKENAVLIEGRGPRLRSPRGTAGLRQLRIDHADVEWHFGRAGICQRVSWRRITVAAADGENYWATGTNGGDDLCSGWRPAAFAHHRRPFECD